MRARVLATQDLYLHIAVGRWILDHRQVPTRGILSGSMADAPWLAHEWLASLGYAALYDHLGWNGVVVVAALVLAGAIAIVAYEVARSGGPIPALTCAVLAWGLCLVHMQARPHLLTLPLFALWIAALIRARRTASAPPLALALVMILWANLHGGFLIAPAFTALFAAEAIYDADSLRQAWDAARRWGLFLAATLAAALLTPHGVDGLLFPIRLTGMTMALAGISEWEPSSLANNPALVIALLLLLFVALTLGLRATVTRVAMVLLLVYMAFDHFRYTELLGLAAPLLLQDALAEPRFAGIGAKALGWGRPLRPVQTAVAASVLGIVTALSLAFAVRNDSHGVDRFTPAAAVDWIEAQRLEGLGMNSYNFGGYLIFRGIAPFIDGRIELYGEAFVVRYFALGQFPALLDRYAIAWTIFEPQNPRNIILDQLAGWKQVYADGQAVIHVRRR